MTTKHAKLSSMQRVNNHYPAEKFRFFTKQCLGTQHNASGEPLGLKSSTPGA